MQIKLDPQVHNLITILDFCSCEPSDHDFLNHMYLYKYKMHEVYKICPGIYSKKMGFFVFNDLPY